jgi:sortase (surface protein transpeptidase)
MKAKMNKRVIVSILVVVLIGVISGGVYAYQSKVEHDKQVKLERDKNYHKLETSADEAVELAYNSRKNIDIENANKSIEKLKNSDQKNLKDKMGKLDKLLSEINSTKVAVEKAVSSKTEADLLNAQKAIDILNDEYQAKDKSIFQENLNNIKKAIADEKARVEQEAKIKAEQEVKVKAEQERKALEQPSGLNQNNVFDYIKKFLIMKGYNPDDFILNNPIGHGPQAPTETPASDTPSSFDVKYQEKDGTGAGMFRVTRTVDSRVQVFKYIGSNLDPDGGEYVSLA